MKLNDPAHVREEYADETRYEARFSIWDNLEGPDPKRVTLDAVAEVEPHRVLEVGCGPGWASEWIAAELGAEVVAVDQSERMVELAQARGVHARVGDVQALPFADGAFDCAVAAWMLYHVPDLDQGLAELARVLRPGGRLVATTVGERSLAELWDLVGADDATVAPFSAESGEASLRRYFSRVERRDLAGRLTFPDREAAYRYVVSSPARAPQPDRLPEWDGPLVCTCRFAVFVAEAA
jgi:ubiquinone/menaquinone biosynthesis C-methylase UbiE